MRPSGGLLPSCPPPTCCGSWTRIQGALPGIPDALREYARAVIKALTPGCRGWTGPGCPQKAPETSLPGLGCRGLGGGPLPGLLGLQVGLQLTFLSWALGRGQTHDVSVTHWVTRGRASVGGAEGVIRVDGWDPLQETGPACALPALPPSYSPFFPPPPLPVLLPSWPFCSMGSLQPSTLHASHL